MKFWTTLRWAGALIFVLIVLGSWLVANHSGGGSNQETRPAPLIVR